MKTWFKSKPACSCSAVCVCVCERERERERERARESVCERERERERDRDRERQRVCVCVWERETERVCVCVGGGGGGDALMRWCNCARVLFVSYHLTWENAYLFHLTYRYILILFTHKYMDIQTILQQKTYSTTTTILIIITLYFIQALYLLAPWIIFSVDELLCMCLR